MAKSFISIYLDTRRVKKEDFYPVKLRVYHNYETRYYPTGISLTQVQFEQSYLANKPTYSDNKKNKIKLDRIESNANQVAEELKIFSFEKFEKNLIRPTGSDTDVFYHYEQVISSLKKEDRFSTASNYELSKKSISSFLVDEGYKNVQLSFDKITVSFLNGYEKWMVSKDKSLTTVGIYLRPLRAIFNSAIADEEIPHEIYPFGKRKYTIPAGRNIKKALSKEDLKKLFECNLPHQSLVEKARDFWFFSYVCNGMNIRDIANLKYKDISDETFQFVRNKTKQTSKANQKPIVVALSNFAQKIIEKYGNQKLSRETYIFPILIDGIGEKEKIRLVQAFTRFINQHIKLVAKNLGINETISTYWARHSFSTMAVQNGASLEYVQESLGHNSLMTTKNYFAGFTDSTKKEITNKLLDF